MGFDNEAIELLEDFLYNLKEQIKNEAIKISKNRKGERINKDTMYRAILIVLMKRGSEIMQITIEKKKNE